MRPKTTNISHQKVNNHTCYLCNKNTVNYSFNKLGYTILKCSNCSLLSLDFNQKYEHFIVNYYQKGYFTGDKKLRAYANYADDKLNITKNAEKLLKRAKKYINQGNLLDIGCAMGFFMEKASQMGFRVYGIEVSDYAASIAQKEFGGRIYKGPVEKFIKDRNTLPKFKDLNFDLITLSDLIEHVNNPRAVLAGLKTLLKNDGLIAIQTGDSNSLWARLMGKNWHFYAPPQHLYFFSKHTLKELLRQAGYEVIKIDKVGKNVSLRYILHMTKYMNIPFLGDYLNNLVSSNTLGKISIPVKLYDNMIVFAKKAS